MSIFKFKHFDILQADNAMKVGTDAMLLGSFVQAASKTKLLDIGTGTGVLSLMIAQKNPTIDVVAVELDQLSAKECAINFANSNWSDRLKVQQADFLTFESSDKFDLIISNPPFYQTRLLNEDSRKSAARHENSLPMNQLLTQVKMLLKTDGDFWLIIPSEDANKWESEGSRFGLIVKNIINVYGKVGGEAKRTIFNFSIKKGDCQIIDFHVRKEDGNYTEEYISLTKEYHHTAL